MADINKLRHLAEQDFIFHNAAIITDKAGPVDFGATSGNIATSVAKLPDVKRIKDKKTSARLGG